MLGSLNVAVDDLHHIVSLRHIFCYVHIYHFMLCLTLVYGFLHHSATHGSHLWTMLRVYDCGNDVSAECRTNLIEQVVIMRAALLVVEITDFELRTVGCQSACQR